MLSLTSRATILGALALAGSAFTALSQPFEFDQADLLLGIQAVGGTGAAQNVFFNLGKTSDFLAGNHPEIIGNIAAELEMIYGSGWFGREDLWFGAAGNRSNLAATIDPGGDGEEPGRTWYVSSTTSAPGQSVIRQSVSSSGLGSGGTFFSGLKNIFLQPASGEQLQATASGAAILDQTAQPTAWNNSWTRWNPVPGAGFNIWAGGIQNHFGREGGAVYIDIQRMVANTAGTYVVTIAIENDGTIRAVRPSSGGGDTAFDEWIARYENQIPNEADRRPGANPTGDGIVNLLKFAFAGNPAVAGDRGTHVISTADANGDSHGDLTLTVEVRAGATFSTSAGAQTATVDGIAYRIEGSENLADFTSPVSQVTPHLGQGSPAAGYEFRTFRLDTSAGLPSKGFLRAVVVESPGN